MHPIGIRLQHHNTQIREPEQPWGGAQRSTRIGCRPKRGALKHGACGSAWCRGKTRYLPQHYNSTCLTHTAGYPPSISSSVGTRSFCECARIWQNDYDLVTQNQTLFDRGTFFRDQQSRLPALQCSHDHPQSRGAHTKELAVSTCEAAHSFRWPAMVVRCALATALVNFGRVRATSQRLTHVSQTCRAFAWCCRG